MAATDRVRIARETYGAYESGDRRMVERHLSPDFRFYRPADVGIDLETYWTRCWPNAEMIAAFEFKRIIGCVDEVLVTYEATKNDGKRFRNTEILTFDEDKIAMAEVYFGWNLD
ncbi:MAG: nuclear transport factor 2 family protein [Actinobacteria bacterium]|nr:MAG: nuclear transport factor 2 family protein [Actinomycetota bacterium]